MLASSPLNPMAFQTPIPKVTLTDLQSSTADATVYTFTACQVNLGGTLTAADTAVGVNPYVPSPSRNFVAVVVHGEDAAATFSVNYVTIGGPLATTGVPGVEIYDRGGAGAGILVNTVFYVWPTESLQNITNTDIYVGFSEAVTGCAIAVLSIENIGMLWSAAAGNATTGGGTLTVNTTGGASSEGVKGLRFVFSTINAAGEEFSFDEGTSIDTHAVKEPFLIYSGSNAEFGYAGAYSYVGSLAGTMPGCTWTLSWSGAANADAISPTVVRV